MDREPKQKTNLTRDARKGTHGFVKHAHGFSGAGLYKIFLTFCVVNRFFMLDISNGVVSFTVPPCLEKQLASFIKEDISSGTEREGFSGSGSIGDGSNIESLLYRGGLLSEIEKASQDLIESKDEQDEEGEQSSGIALLLQDLDYFSAQSTPLGTGGVHFVPDKKSGQFKVVFKPRDEENESSKGTGFIREYAAHLVDQGMAGVPETTVTILDLGKGPQLGSAQLYVEDSEDAEDFGFGAFSVEDVHRIGVLDARILNCDRHSGNLMRNKNTGKLIPIDHGTAFPELDSLGKCSFEWLRYPQAKMPFDKALLTAIREIDPEQDAQKLALAGLSEGAQLGAWMSTTLLKLGAAQGKSLFEIGSLIQRARDRSELSQLEKLYIRVRQESKFGFSKPLFERYAQELL